MAHAGCEAEGRYGASVVPSNQLSIQLHSHVWVCLGHTGFRGSSGKRNFKAFCYGLCHIYSPQIHMPNPNVTVFGVRR